MLNIPDGLRDKYKKAVDLLDEHDKFRIITHYDADGISAAAVISRTLMKAGKGFHATFMESAPKDPPEDLPLIFTDLGASELERISSIKEPAIVLDHHKVDNNISDAKDKVFINPHDFNIDGAQEVSGGTLAFLLAVYHDETNWIKSIYGLAGAAADKQNIGGFKGLNKQILDASIERKVLTSRTGLLIDGDGIRDALLKSCDPYFPGISGDEDKIDKILDNANLDPSTPVDEMPKSAERKIVSILSLSLLKRDIPSHIIENIKGKRYISEKKGISVDEMYKLMNACARVSQPGLALSFCLGDEGALNKAIELREEYRQDMVIRLIELENEGVECKDSLQYFYEDRKTRKGELAGLGMLYIFDQDKPVLGLCTVKDRIDISARGTKKMIERGLDLGKICRGVSDKYGGSGGGHNIAAGATVPKSDIDGFLNDMDKEIGRILG